MDNVYGLKKDDEVVILDNYESTKNEIKKFEINESSYKSFIDANKGIVFTVKQVFGNRILLSNNKFVFDFNIKPNKDTYIIFKNLRNVIKFILPDNDYDDMMKVVKDNNIKFEAGYGFDIKKDGSLIMPYKKELFDYNQVKITLDGWLQVDKIKKEIAKIF